MAKTDKNSHPEFPYIKAMEQKMKMKEGGGKVYPVGGNVARKVHRNDNPHLDRLHPPQIPELVAQKQVSVCMKKIQ